VLLVSFLNMAASVVPSSVSVKETFRSVTKLWLSVSRTCRYRVSVWVWLLFARLLFPCRFRNCSVSAVTVKLFRAVSGVLFWFCCVLLALNLKKNVPRSWSLVRFIGCFLRCRLVGRLWLRCMLIVWVLRLLRLF